MRGPAVTAPDRGRRRLIVVLAISVLALVGELVGAKLSGSLALLADAGHSLTDVAGITVAVVAVTFAVRPASAARSYGNFRAEVLAALINAVALLAISAWVFVEAIDRLRHPPTVSATPMLLLGLVALAANGVALAVLRPARGASVNVRGAYLEVLGDLFGAAVVVVAAVVLATSGWRYADVVASFVMVAFMVPRAVVLLRETVHVLFEGAPPDVDVAVLKSRLGSVPGVVGVHDLHVWTITSGMPVLSAHVVAEESALSQTCGRSGILDRLCAIVGDDFDVEHSTFQLEPAGHLNHERGAHT
jgi:cobalt-zinc-cadmium efflux system protein